MKHRDGHRMPPLASRRLLVKFEKGVAMNGVGRIVVFAFAVLTTTPVSAAEWNAYKWLQPTEAGIVMKGIVVDVDDVTHLLYQRRKNGALPTVTILSLKQREAIPDTRLRPLGVRNWTYYFYCPKLSTLIYAQWW